MGGRNANDITMRSILWCAFGQLIDLYMDTTTDKLSQALKNELYNFIYVNRGANVQKLPPAFDQGRYNELKTDLIIHGPNSVESWLNAVITYLTDNVISSADDS